MCARFTVWAIGFGREKLTSHTQARMPQKIRIPNRFRFWTEQEDLDHEESGKRSPDPQSVDLRDALIKASREASF